MLFDRCHHLRMRHRARQCHQVLGDAYCSREPNLHNGSEGLSRGLAEHEGGAGGSGARSVVHWAHGKVDILPPPPFCGQHSGKREASKTRPASRGRLHAGPTMGGSEVSPGPGGARPASTCAPEVHLASAPVFSKEHVDHDAAPTRKLSKPVL